MRKLRQQEKITAWLRPRIALILQRWQSLGQREKITVFIGGSIATILAIYATLWSPLLKHLSSMREQLVHEKKINAKLLELHHQVLLLEKRPKKQGAKSLNLVIKSFQEKIKQASLDKSLKELSALDANKLHCRFENADFDALLIWLISFIQQEKLSISSTAMRKINNHGLVQVEFVLGRE